MVNLIKKVIHLYEKYAKRKPDSISLGFLDYAVYKNSDEFSTTVEGVLIHKKTWPAEGIFVDNNIKEITPFVTIMEEMANYENRALKEPNYITLSYEFYNTYKDELQLDGTEVYNTTFNCIIGVDNDQLDDVLCEYKSLIAEDIDRYRRTLNCIEFYYDQEPPKIGESAEDDEDEDFYYGFGNLSKDVHIDPPELDPEPKKDQAKEDFITWLIEDDEALINSMIYIDEHEEEIDEAFTYFQREMQFEKWLEKNEKEDDGYYGYY